MLDFTRFRFPSLKHRSNMSIWQVKFSSITRFNSSKLNYEKYSKAFWNTCSHRHFQCDACLTAQSSVFTLQSASLILFVYLWLSRARFIWAPFIGKDTVFICRDNVISFITNAFVCLGKPYNCTSVWEF